ncbi:MAG: PLP-dependent aminotransferase family protein [Clostridia bacterium]|nr:PLP-dependent aminotransferase family protein [Clostridia bacterium]
MLFDFADLGQKNRGELYHTLYTKIKEAAELGAIKKGEKLPSVREAAKQLGVSRTTVENAYTRLCIEGIAESRPQRGYFITGNNNNFKSGVLKSEPQTIKIEYDFSSRSIDTDAADTEAWKRTLRSVLWDSSLLTSYGESMGEIKLRKALADYSYKARGVRADAENIVIGAGVGPLLNILCGLIGREVTIGIENGGFAEAEGIFSDYGINTILLKSDSNGAIAERLNQNEIDVLFLLPSLLSKISVSAINNRRNEYIKWVREKKNRLIIEDDYNGELRYTARTVSAFQGKAPENTVYIGSFSKLLLPSVRIAYMVLPTHLSEALKNRKTGYNQTCGKIEQLALSEYILKGALEKQLRRLRRIYYNKSLLLCEELKKGIPDCDIKLYESSLTLELSVDKSIKSEEISSAALKSGIRLIKTEKEGTVRLCFAGISEQKIPAAAKKLSSLLKEL